MPRAFTSNERDLIAARLIDAGRRQFALHGLRRTNVAGLARAAGIAKGSFYLFHASKEALLLALLVDRQTRLRTELAELADDPALAPRDRIDGLIRAYLEFFRDDPLRAALGTPEDTEALARALPPGALERAQADEDSHFLDLLQPSQEAGELTPLDPETWIGLLRTLRSVGSSEERIGPARFAKTIDLLVSSLSDSLAW